MTGTIGAKFQGKELCRAHPEELNTGIRQNLTASGKQAAQGQDGGSIQNTRNALEYPRPAPAAGVPRRVQSKCRLCRDTYIEVAGPDGYGYGLCGVCCFAPPEPEPDAQQLPLFPERNER